MAEFKGSINVKRNIEKCFELFDFSEENVKKLDETILFHNIQNQTEEIVGSTYLQGRDDNGNILETTLEITEYINEDDYKKIGAHFLVGNFFEVDYYYELKKTGENSTELTYYTNAKTKKFLLKILHKLSKIDKQYSVDNLLKHVKSIIEKN